jgi:hypothetical protein
MVRWHTTDGGSGEDWRKGMVGVCNSPGAVGLRQHGQVHRSLI